MKPSSNTPTVRELEEQYLTTRQAVDYVRDRLEDNSVTRRQIVRAIVDGNIEAVKVGRLYYIHRDQMRWYSDHLRPTRTDPTKLRLVQGRSRS